MNESKQDSIVRYVKKDSIWHCDLKTRLEFFLKIHSFVWKSTQDCIVRYVTKDLKDLNSYQKFIAWIEIVNKISLLAVRYMEKDSIWHLDLKPRLEF